MVALCAVWITVLAINPARAADGPTTRGALDQLNRETTALYKRVQSGIYYVQLPQSKSINAYAMAGMDKWDKKLDPQVRRRLEQSLPALAEATIEGVRPDDGAPRAIDPDSASVPGQGTYIIIRPQDGEGQHQPLLGGKLEPEVKNQPGFTANNIGLLLDDAGHILVPLYVEREAVGEQAVKVAGPDGTVMNAKFIGSDRQTNLTLLKVEAPAGRPVALAGNRPDAGSLVLCLLPSDGSGRLCLWTDGAAENGIIVDTEARVCGVARYGQFLSGSACKLITEQLVRYGSVKRATLGVLITEIRKDDPLRRQQPVLGARSAMRIDQVIAGSTAERAGLKQGDLVLTLAGQSVSDIPSFAAAIAARTGLTELQVLRGNQVLTVTVDLQQQR